MKKAYQVAYKYEQKSQELTSKDTSDRGKHKQSNSETLLNIFKNNQEMRLRKLDLSLEKEYHIVGIGEFLVYNRVKERRRRDLRSNGDQRSFGTFVSVRTSRTPIQNAGYLTKQQVLKFCSPQSSKKDLFNQMQEEHLFSTKQNQNDSTFSSLVSPRNKNSNLNTNRSCKDKFSLSKLKAKVQGYQKIWKKYQKKSQDVDTTPTVLKKRCRLNQNDKNGYRMLKRHRLCKPKQLDRQYSATAFDSIPWSETLRTQYQDLILKDEYVQKIDPKGLTLSGQNKLNKQTEWIQKKYNQGYFFEKKTLKNMIKIND